MLKIYKSVENKLLAVQEVGEGCWVNLVNPTDEEVDFISGKLMIDIDFIRSALDEEERPRIESEEETSNILIIVDIPYMELSRDSRIYETMPLAIIATDFCVVTVCLRENLVMEGFLKSLVKTFYTYKKSRFILQILYRNASLFLQYLRQIDKQSVVIETELHKSMKNKELIQLLDLEKSLVYFSTSLRSNQLVLEKLLRYNFMKKYQEDTELLEDTIIENRQAIEMAKIHSDILSGTMDAFASVISNNLNIVMKILASITIVMAIPTIISSFFGMNVPVPMASNPFAFVIIMLFSIIICFIAAYVMSKRDMF